MNNQMMLNFILKTDELLREMGRASQIIIGNEKRKVLKKIDAEKHKMQSVCYDPFLMASKIIGASEIRYTCLVCGKEISGTTLNHVVNLTEDGLIEGDWVEEFAVNQLKFYLTENPPLSEAEIRDALRRDIAQYVKQR